MLANCGCSSLFQKRNVFHSQEIFVMLLPDWQLNWLLQFTAKQSTVGPCLELHFVRVVSYRRPIRNFPADFSCYWNLICRNFGTFSSILLSVWRFVINWLTDNSSCLILMSSLGFLAFVSTSVEALVRLLWVAAALFGREIRVRWSFSCLFTFLGNVHLQSNELISIKGPSASWFSDSVNSLLIFSISPMRRLNSSCVKETIFVSVLLLNWASSISFFNSSNVFNLL